MNKPHKHAEVIKAWADGAEIECRNSDSDFWRTCIGTPNWYEGLQYRVLPEPEYPTTSLNLDELHNLFHEKGTFDVSIIRVANAAIKQAIIDGDVIVNLDKD